MKKNWGKNWGNTLILPYLRTGLVRIAVVRCRAMGVHQVANISACIQISEKLAAIHIFTIIIRLISYDITLHWWISKKIVLPHQYFSVIRQAKKLGTNEERFKKLRPCHYITITLHIHLCFSYCRRMASLLTDDKNPYWKFKISFCKYNRVRYIM